MNDQPNSVRSNRMPYVLAALSAGMLGYGMSLASAHPPDAVQGEFVRIIHVHVPASWLAFLAFGVTLLGGLLWLVTKKPLFDAIAAASAEIGVLFTGLSLLTGMIWGNVTWGIAWDWGDQRMASTALMFFVYLGYLALRRAIADPVVRARRSAILGSIAFLQVPLVYFSVNLFRSLHQTQSVRPDGWTIENNATVGAMLLNLGAFTMVYLTFLLWRTRQELIEMSLERQPITEGLAGSAISPPTLGMNE